MIEGTIIKGIAGFYYVEADGKVYECKARGKFRKQRITPCIGDLVLIECIEDSIAENAYETASIEEILPRRNHLVRPSVANIDQAMIVFAISYPELHLDLLDKFLLHVEKENISACIVLNKIDDKPLVDYEGIASRYKNIGYDVLCLSAKKHIALEQLKEKLVGKITVFAGPSGVGKSTIINALHTELKMQTGEVSTKIKRGKHTTRHVELLQLPMGGFVLDTPGFTSLELTDMDKDELREYFPELRAYEGQCKFTGCTHTHEPHCKVKEAVEQGEIDKERYDRYKTYYEQLKNIRRW